MTEKRKKDIRLVVSDIDGTLIRRGEGFPKEVEQAAAELKKEGDPLYLCLRPAALYDYAFCRVTWNRNPRMRLQWHAYLPEG